MWKLSSSSEMPLRALVLLWSLVGSEAFSLGRARIPRTGSPVQRRSAAKAGDDKEAFATLVLLRHGQR